MPSPSIGPWQSLFLRGIDWALICSVGLCHRLPWNFWVKRMCITCAHNNLQPAVILLSQSRARKLFLLFQFCLFFLKGPVRFALVSVLAGMFSCCCFSSVFLAPACAVVRCPLGILESPRHAIGVSALPDRHCNSLRGFVGKWARGSRTVRAADLVLVASRVRQCGLQHGRVFCLFELSRLFRLSVFRL